MSKCIICDKYYAVPNGDKCSVCAKEQQHREGNHAEWTICVKTLERSLTLKLDKNTTIHELKLMLCNMRVVHAPDMTQVIFAGRRLDDNSSLEDSMLRDGITLHVVSMLRAD